MSSKIAPKHTNNDILLKSNVSKDHVNNAYYIRNNQDVFRLITIQLYNGTQQTMILVHD